MKSKEKSDDTVANKIWEEIKDKQVNMFALPNQKVSNFCQPKLVEPSKCYLTYTVTSILPALESALGANYKVELAGRFLTVSYVSTNI